MSLKEIPGWFYEGGKHLTHICLAWNDIRGVDERILDMPNPIFLDLSRNQISELRSFGRNKNEVLKTLFLVGNKDLTIAENTEDLDALKKSIIDYNPMDTKFFEKVGKLPRPEELTILGAGIDELKSFEGVGCMTSLRALGIIRVGISKVPEEVPQMHFLEELSLSHNEISDVSEGLFAMERLEKPNLAHNEIYDLVDFCAKVNDKRKVLHLEGNEMSKLGQRISKLGVLEKLYW